MITFSLFNIRKVIEKSQLSLAESSRNRRGFEKLLKKWSPPSTMDKFTHKPRIPSLKLAPLPLIWDKVPLTGYSRWQISKWLTSYIR